MFIASNLPAIRRALGSRFYGAETEPRNATNCLTVANKQGITRFFLNFGNKETWQNFKSMLLALPPMEGETANFEKMDFSEGKICKDENSHRENFVRYYLPSFEGESKFVTLKCKSLRQAKLLAKNLQEVMPYIKSIELIKETLNGAKFELPPNDISKVLVFSKLKERKFAMPRYSMVVARNDEGRQQAIFRRRN
jgi:hypothetical protein